MKVILPLSCALLVASCAIRPLPEQVTGITTFNIVKQIRCETREAVFNTFIKALANLYLAPNNIMTGVQASNPPPGFVNGAATNLMTVEFTIESSNVYYVGSGAGSAVAVLGWEDNL